MVFLHRHGAVLPMAPIDYETSCRSSAALPCWLGIRVEQGRRVEYIVSIQCADWFVSGASARGGSGSRVVSGAVSFYFVPVGCIMTVPDAG